MTGIDPRMTGEDFVEVHDEPRHRFRFRNDYVHVYDVLIPPGDASLYHRHMEDTLYVGVTDAHATTQEQGKELIPGITPQGFSACLCHRDRPIIHQVGNIGAKDIRLIGAEARARPEIASPRALSLPGHDLAWETARLRGYQVALEPGQTLEDVEYNFSGLMVFLSEGCLSTSAAGAAASIAWISPGDWRWLDGPRRWTLANMGSSPIRAILGEWL